MNSKIITLMILICALTGRLFSLELELSGGAGNIAFDQGSTTALSDPAVEGTFGPHLYPLVLARLSGEEAGIGYNGGFERDRITGNRLFANLKLEREYFSLEAGPFIGLFNTSKLPFNPGLSAALGFTVPGIIFANVQGSSTLGAPMDITGNYYVNTGNISAGFWVPYVICSLNMSVRNYTVRKNSNLLIENTLDRYFFSADVYSKNVPYTIRADLGFQDLKRSYTSEEVTGGSLERKTQTDTLRSVFMGFELTYTASSVMKFILGGEMPVYSWADQPMKDPSKNTFLFEARAGIVLTLQGGGE